MTLKILNIKLDLVVSMALRDLPKVHEVNITTLYQFIPPPNESNIMMGWRGLQAVPMRNHHGRPVVKGPRLQIIRAKQNIFRAKWPVGAKIIIVNNFRRPAPYSRKSKSQLKIKCQLKIVRTMVTPLWTT